MAAQVKVTGIDEIVAAIKKMADTFTPEDVQEILNDEGEVLADVMRGLVPENTGRLYNSIGVLKRDNNKFPYTVLVGVDYSKGAGGTMTLPALASVIEYGAAARYPKKGRDYSRVKIGDEWVTMTKEKPFSSIPARPFIRPAFDAHGSTIQKNIIERLYKLAVKRGKGLGFDAK